MSKQILIESKVFQGLTFIVETFGTQSLNIHDLTENQRSEISDFPLNHEYSNSVKKPLTPYVERQIVDLPLNDSQ